MSTDVGETKGRRVAQRPDDDELPANGWLGALGLKDGAHAGSDAHADAVDDAADDHLREVPGDDLQDGAHGVEEDAEGHAPFASQLVAKDEGRDGAAKGTELVWSAGCMPSTAWEAHGKAARCDSGNIGIAGFGEMQLEVGADEDTGEDTC